MYRCYLRLEHLFTLTSTCKSSIVLKMFVLEVPKSTDNKALSLFQGIYFTVVIGHGLKDFGIHDKSLRKTTQTSQKFTKETIQCLPSLHFASTVDF